MSDRARIGQGREAEILEAGDGRVLRLLWDPEAEPRRNREEAALRAASGAGAPVPEVHERATEDGRPGLVMERLDGPDLLTRIGKRPWSLPSAGRLLGRLHARLHEVPAPEQLPDVKETIGDLLERRGDLVPDDLVAEARTLLEELPDGDRVCHGDYHPANILMTDDGPRVIDWATASRGDPMADVCRTLLIFELAPVPEGAPGLVRRLDRLGRSVMMRSYLRAYGSPDRGVIDRWRILLMIARLAEDVEEERPVLLKKLRERD